jgi:uncharacterized protein YqjF (DUF2071 family)
MTAPAEVDRGRPFLTARWLNLILAQYAVPDEVLQPYLPPGVELDHFEGEAYVSLVGFQFLDTRVLGIPWPTFRNFPEWNLRIYVRHQGCRGVCFVREFVPQRFVAWVARTIYNEPYQAARMSMSIENRGANLEVAYTVEHAKRTHRLAVVANSSPETRPADSLEHFFKEHSWGYGRTRRGKLIRYEVMHPEWRVHPVQSFSFEVDWGKLYGPAWEQLQGMAPRSVVLAEGSAVSVYPKGTLSA